MIYIGKTGNKYSSKDYVNWGNNNEMAPDGRKSLPYDEYPYTTEPDPPCTHERTEEYTFKKAMLKGVTMTFCKDCHVPIGK